MFFEPSTADIACICAGMYKKFILLVLMTAITRSFGFHCLQSVSGLKSYVTFFDLSVGSSSVSLYSLSRHVTNTECQLYPLILENNGRDTSP